MQAIGASYAQKNAEMLESAFQKLDTDNNGSLSVQELGAVLKNNEAVIAKEGVQNYLSSVEQFMDKFDENRDGMIHKAEFIEAMGQFVVDDGDADGIEYESAGSWVGDRMHWNLLQFSFNYKRLKQG